MYPGRDSCTATLQLEGNNIKIIGMPWRLLGGGCLARADIKKMKGSGNL